MQIATATISPLPIDRRLPGQGKMDPDNRLLSESVISCSGGITMAKYGKKAGEKVEKVMHERKEGTLKSGRSGKKVTSKKQAIAIGLSEARRAGAKVPKKKTSKKTATKKKTSKK